ncbi:MAG: ABC transporter permease [Deltaproteobacteria bacterium]|nr:MAG: ABC transporter permease [Deltaproteobacteria bacterium]
MNRLFVITISVICVSFIFIPILHLLFSIDLTALSDVLTDKELWSAVKISLVAAFFSSLIGLFIGMPLGFLIARKEFYGKSLLESITFLPIVIPHVAVGIMLLCLFSSMGISIADTIYGIIIAMCFVSISYAISSCIMGFNAVDPELEWTARSLGASPWYAFLKITFPLVLPYIGRGFILSFARAVSEVGAILIIAYYPKSVPILIYERFENFGLTAAKPIAAFIIVLGLLIFSIFIYLNRIKRDVF